MESRKNETLKAERRLCFENVAELVRSGEELDGIFLKTIYPSRDLNKQNGGLP